MVRQIKKKQLLSLNSSPLQMFAALTNHDKWSLAHVGVSPFVVGSINISITQTFMYMIWSQGEGNFIQHFYRRTSEILVSILLELSVVQSFTLECCEMHRVQVPF